MPDSREQSFKQDFSTYRHRHLLAVIKSALQDGLSAAALSALAIAVPARLLSPWLWLVIPFLFVVVSIALLHRRWPSFKTSVLSFDRQTRSNSAVTNFLELQGNGRDDAFARCAMQRGLSFVQAYGKTVLPPPPPPARFTWSYWLAPLVILLILLWPVSVDQAPQPAQNLSNETKNSQETILRPATSALKEATRWLHRAQTEAQVAGKFSAKSTLGAHQQGLSSASGAVSGAEAVSAAASSATSGLSQTAQEAQPNQATSPQSQDSQPNNSSKGSSSVQGNSDGDDSLSGDESQSDSDVSISASTGSGASTPQKQAQRTKRKAEKAQGAGMQLMPNDRLPSASNEQSEGETGDDPGEGNGGENGHKKSRGAAPMLPVIPEPDTVSGRLGSGVELTNVLPAPTPDLSTIQPRRHTLTPGKEPVGLSTTLPETLRVRLRKADIKKGAQE